MTERFSNFGTSLAGTVCMLVVFMLVCGPLAVHAQASPCPPGTADAHDGTGCQPTSSAPTAAPASSGGGSALGQAANSAWDFIQSITTDVLLKPVVLIAFLIFTLCTWILGIVGVLFNWTVIRTVFQFATYFGNSQGLLTAWGILRDIGNIVLLFGFIFMGVSTILNLPHSEYTAKRALPALIIFAILMNFSLFAAETLIDVANGFSSTFATQAGQGCATGTSASECAGTVGISGAIFQMTGLNPIFNPDVLAGTHLHGIPEIVVFLILSLFVIITALVLLAGALMLVARAVVLVFLIITSPIGFAGMAIPPMHEMASTWWKQLLNQAFFAPVFILMMLISISLAKGLSGGDGNLVAAIAGGTNGISSSGGLQGVLVFALVIGFMIAALISAKRFGAAGADFATKTAANYTFGALGFVGRRTGGALGNYAKGQITQARRSGLLKNPNTARQLYNFANWTTKQSFDPRTVANKALKPAGIDLGSPNKEASHGFHGIEEKEKKNREEFAKQLRLSQEQEETLNEIKDAIEKQSVDDKTNLATLREAHKATEAPLRKRIEDKQAEIDKMKDGPEKDTKVRELNNMLEQFKIVREDNAEARKDLENSQKTQMAALESSKKAAENSAKKEYADALHEQSKNKFISAFTPEGAADHHASETIIKDLKKSKSEKLLEDIKGSIDQGNSDEAKSKLTEAENASDHGGH